VWDTLEGCPLWWEAARRFREGHRGNGLLEYGRASSVTAAAGPLPTLSRNLSSRVGLADASGKSRKEPTSSNIEAWLRVKFFNIADASANPNTGTQIS